MLVEGYVFDGAALISEVQAIFDVLCDCVVAERTFDWIGGWCKVYSSKFSERVSGYGNVLPIIESKPKLIGLFYGIVYNPKVDQSSLDCIRLKKFYPVE